MYKDFFGFKILPFENTPDPDFFYMGAGYRDTLALMKHSVVTRKGLLGIAGPIGCGKTTLANALTDNLPETSIVISMLTPMTSTEDMVAYIAKCLDVSEIPDSSLMLHDVIRSELVRINEEGRHCVLIIDESHLMSDLLFQEVLFLANLETSKFKLIQILLLGQMELLDRLNEPRRLQLAQRISVIQVIEPMNENQSQQYIKHRLKMSEGPESIFTEEALSAIANMTEGIPRLINKLCDASLLKAFIAQRKSVEEEDVYTAKKEIGIDEFPAKGRFMYSRPDRGKRSHPYFLTEFSKEKKLRGEEKTAEEEKKHDCIPVGDKNQVITKTGAKISRILGSHWLKSALVFLVVIFLLSGILKNCSQHVVPVQENMELSEKKEMSAPEEMNVYNDETYDTVIREETNLEMAIEQMQQASSEQSESDLSGIDVETDLSGTDVHTPEIPGSTIAAEKIEQPVVKEPVLKSGRQEQLLASQEESYPYSILLASFRSKFDVDRSLAIFKDRGVPSSWNRVDLGDHGIWFRVFTGYFESVGRAEAEIKMKRLEGAVVKQTKFTVLVGTYSDEDELYAKKDALNDSGYSSYSIQREEGKYNLYVGSFYTKRGSEIQCAELAASGINCQAVER